MGSPTLELLIEQKAIEELTYRYAYALDNKDWGTLADCFTKNATLVTGAPPDEFAGHAEIKSGMARITEKWDGGILHPTGNHQYTIDGEKANGTCIFAAYQWQKADTSGENLNFVAGRYLDQLVKIDGRWLFEHRIIDVTRDQAI